jgi:glycosyltransferase involved in cell wall biosynthesis
MVRDRRFNVESQPLHIAINAQLVSFSSSFRNAGVSRYTYTLLTGLGELTGNQRYTAFVNAGESASIRSSSLAGRERVQLVPSGGATSSAVARIRWEQLVLPGELRRRGVDVFHSPVNVLPLRIPCASVVTVHDLAYLRYPQYFRPSRRIYQRVFTAGSVKRATRVVAVSEATKRDLVERFQLPPDHVDVVYPVVDDDFRPCLDQAILGEFRARRRLPERYILFLGTLEPRKNVTLLLEAYARLRRLDAQAPQLVIAGAQGWYYQTIFERVRTLGLQSYVTFAGYVSRQEQPLWYAAAELFVYPSVYEGFGMPVAEALACGTPTITSTVSSLPEAGGTVALQVDPGDVEALACAMQGSLGDQSARSRALFEGPRWSSRFSCIGAAESYAKIYQQAARTAALRHGQWGR